MDGNPIRLTIGMKEGKPYGIDNAAVPNYDPNEYREDECGIDLLEPYCSSTCPHDCISGQWESVHAKERTKDDGNNDYGGYDDGHDDDGYDDDGGDDDGHNINDDDG